eukprot:Sspe_Gene.15911::Locus_5557_Transcript_1_1_Confidence_1.000_Length_610::g.15911::m.15911
MPAKKAKLTAEKEEELYGKLLEADAALQKEFEKAAPPDLEELEEKRTRVAAKIPGFWADVVRTIDPSFVTEADSKLLNKVALLKVEPFMALKIELKQGETNDAFESESSFVLKDPSEYKWKGKRSDYKFFNSDTLELMPVLATLVAGNPLEIYLGNIPDEDEEEEGEEDE